MGRKTKTKKKKKKKKNVRLDRDGGQVIHGRAPWDGATSRQQRPALEQQGPATQKSATPTANEPPHSVETETKVLPCPPTTPTSNHPPVV